MKKISLLIAIICSAAQLAAQPAGRIHRTQATPYETRVEAEARSHAKDAAYKEFKPQLFLTQGDTLSYGQVVEIPFAWTDGCVYLHLENVGSAYTLAVNDKIVAHVEDPTAPADFYLSPLIREGNNAVVLDLRPSRTPLLQQATPKNPRAIFSQSYIHMQNKRNIADFTMALVPDSTGRFGVLQLDVLAQNAYNYPETVTVGYDIYSPQGKLLDYNIVDRVIEGRSIDTVRFNPYVYKAFDNRWEAGAKNPPLYKVMLFTRRSGAYKEYMPLTVGFNDVSFRNGKFYNFGKELKLSEARYNAAATLVTTRKELTALKTQGRNTIRPDYPQPAWFYELCNELGLYVIDRANINAPHGRGDMSVGGTPSNDPAMVKEYIERVKAMYFRSRNFTCVIGYSLGGESGNGYAMQRAYQWLKSTQSSRPVIYIDANGEWNSDL